MLRVIIGSAACEYIMHALMLRILMFITMRLLGALHNSIAGLYLNELILQGFYARFVLGISRAADTVKPAPLYVHWDGFFRAYKWRRFLYSFVAALP